MKEMTDYQKEISSIKDLLTLDAISANIGDTVIIINSYTGRVHGIVKILSIKRHTASVIVEDPGFRLRGEILKKGIIVNGINLKDEAKCLKNLKDLEIIEKYLKKSFVE